MTRFHDSARWYRWVILAAIAAGCSHPLHSTKTLTLATTTSTRDSGLLDVLVPRFEAETGIVVKVVAVGSGQALELGRRGDADVLLTHAPKAEEEFMGGGFGEQRHPVMHNDFVIVGVKEDSAGIRDTSSAVDAFRLISERGTVFVSRGDESGTHSKETRLWTTAGIAPHGDWYVRAGAGMAATLRVASEKRGYTLSDRSTFLAQRDGLDLTILFEGDSQLNNPYSVILVNSRRHPHVNRKGAHRFTEFLIAAPTQQIIGAFGVEQFGQPLFFPDAQQ